MSNTLESLIDYMVDNGLSDEEANHIVHLKFRELKDRTVFDLVRDKEWSDAWSFVRSYMLGL